MTSVIPFADRLHPAPPDAGFRLPDQWIWCGSAIRGDDGQYHLFASMWSKDVPFSPNWLTNSRVVRAIADQPLGPYTYAGEVLPVRGREHWDGLMTHNPTIHRHGDTYLLYYTGTTYDGPMPDADHPEVPDTQRLQARANQRIGLATASSPAGPWTRRDAPILESRPGHWDALMTTNPAPCVAADGSVILLYKSTDDQKSPIEYGVTRAANWSGPYERVLDGPLFPQFHEAGIPYEDAYVWREGDGPWQMIFNDMSGKLTGEDHAGAHALSDDGVHWRLADPPKAYSRRLRWADGTETTQGSFERPQVLVENGRATCLFAATGDGPGGFWNASHTWNVALPLATD